MATPKKKKKPAAEKAEKPADRHDKKKKQMQIRLHPILKRQIKVLADRNLTNMSDEFTAAVRKHLAENGLWPVPQSPQPAD